MGGDLRKCLVNLADNLLLIYDTGQGTSLFSSVLKAIWL